MQPGLERRGRARKVRLPRYILDPGRLAGGPYPPGQPDPWSEPDRPAQLEEVIGIDPRRLPGVDIAQNLLLPIENPDRSELESKRFADTLEEFRRRFSERWCFREDPDDCVVDRPADA